ncbi:DUF3127 domain-containing protein [Rudanella paleaurantiibacter]|uniref:DUF3127 domain-containing protein n=1 Tax=Rudanella paleaurantiibacter TaxID=2614655 RepID=A0A7J5TXJ5_9BACT|nr:DUF3127 domain-containing protein [Rudanella paleaurantiibacter]KAB7728146.1 DUF3127 domain-containing protein [Rudanella paleaurantiibacter]
MSNQLSITGTFLGAGSTEFVGRDGTFATRKFYVDLTTNPEYPNTPEFQLKQDKVALVDNLKKGQTVKVSFNLSGRKVVSKQTGKEIVITTNDAWKVELITTQSAVTANRPQPVSAPAPAPAPVSAPASAHGAVPFQSQSGDEDLPF